MASTGIDAYYTPEPVAATLAAILTDGQRSVGRAADFAVGGGVLLDELARADALGELHGTDVDQRAIRSLRARRPTWRVGTCNFLNERSHRRCAVTKSGQPFDTIALNPPYSYRGGEVLSIAMDDATIPCSPAASFVGLASRYSHAETSMAAVLPKGSLTSERDAQFWKVMSEAWSWSIVSDLPRGWLTGTHAAAVIVHLRRRRRSAQDSEAADQGLAKPAFQVTVVRGCTPMHKVKKRQRGVLVLHTTSLTHDGPKPFRGNARGRIVKAPAVLLPRVGQPVPWKVQVYSHKRQSVLSDCVIALQCSSGEDADAVSQVLSENWSTVKEAWGGSCAPYVTLERLRAALAGVGIRAV